MSLVVIFDEGASPQKVLGVLRAAHTPDYDQRTDVLINPDILDLDGLVFQKYWKHDTGAIIEYTQAEKDAQDAAELASFNLSVRTTAKSNMVDFAAIPLVLRSFADVVKDEINILRTLHSLPDRTLSQLKDAIQARVDSGDAD